MTYPKRSPIGWTDYSAGAANFVIGCTPVSEGCANCYAADWAKRAGRDFSEVRVYHKKLNALLRWKPTPGNTPYRRGPGSKPMCFVVDLGDPFHDDVPFEFIARAWATMVHRDDIDFQVLTKRPARALELLSSYHFRGSVAAYVGRFRNPSADIWDPIITVLPWPPANIWIGVTAENQARADERIPILLQVPAAVRFVSIEPMLEGMEIHRYLGMYLEAETVTAWSEGGFRMHAQPGKGWIKHAGPHLDWVIVGAESGAKRRPFDKEWAVSVRDQCQAAGIPYFFKQSSARYPGYDPTLEGRTWQEWPEVAQ